MSAIGVIADVHGNLPALRAVVARLGREGAERWICAGDLVGYGAAPDACVEVVLGLPDVIAVAGNHDLLALGQLDPGHHSAAVRRSTEWTRRHLSASSRASLEGLPSQARTTDGIVVTHGALGDPEHYVRTSADATRELERLGREDEAARGLVLGHTHLPLRVRTGQAGRWAVNPGAVGQSRERRMLARGALLGGPEGDVRFVSIRYDLAAARTAQRRAGLPEEFLHLRPRPLPLRVLRRLARPALRRRGS